MPVPPFIPTRIFLWFMNKFPTNHILLHLSWHTVGEIGKPWQEVVKSSLQWLETWRALPAHVLFRIPVTRHPSSLCPCSSNAELWLEALTHLANIFQKRLLVPTELSHFGPIQPFAGLYPLILEGRQAPCKDCLTFTQRRKEKIFSKHKPNTEVFSDYHMQSQGMGTGVYRDGMTSADHSAMQGRPGLGLTAGLPLSITKGISSVYRKRTFYWEHTGSWFTVWGWESTT